MTVPSWYELLLLTLAAYRLYRLAARDTITEPVRAAVSYPDDQAVTLSHEPADRIEVAAWPEVPKPLRVYASTLIRCPWCLGFYASVAVWAAWEIWPRPALFLAVPLAISTLLGLAAKNLDR